MISRCVSRAYADRRTIPPPLDKAQSQLATGKHPRQGVFLHLLRCYDVWNKILRSSPRDEWKTSRLEPSPAQRWLEHLSKDYPQPVEGAKNILGHETYLKSCFPVLSGKRHSTKCEKLHNFETNGEHHATHLSGSPCSFSEFVFSHRVPFVGINGDALIKKS